MYYKVIILDIEEGYCFALTEEGAVIRIKKKEGLREGDKIYALQEDLYVGEASRKDHVVIPFTKGRRVKKSYLSKITAVAAAVMVCFASLVIPQLADPAYATISFDGDKSVQIEVDRDGKVVKAVSFDQTISEEELTAMKGRSLRQLQDMVDQLNEKENEMIVVAYAGLKEKPNTSLKNDINDVTASKEVLCLEGSKADVKAAEKAGKSLGLYMIEKAVSENQLEKLLKGVSNEQIVKFLEKHGEMIPEETKKKLLKNSAQPKDKKDSYYDDDDEKDIDDDEDDDDDDRVVSPGNGDDDRPSWKPGSKDDDDDEKEDFDDEEDDDDEEEDEAED